MITPALPANEAERLEALHRNDIMDTVPEREYDDITLLASRICGTPMALVGLIDDRRQWFKSKVGFEGEETRRDLTFCAHAILKPEETMVVPDALQDKRFFDNPSVTDGLKVRFYAGTPLMSPDQQVLGTLCVIDPEPRKGLDPAQLEALEALAREVTTQMELRLAKKTLAEKNADLEKLNAQKNQFIGMAAHDLRNPLQVVSGYSKLLSNNLLGALSADQGKVMESINRNCELVLKLVDDLLAISKIESGELQLDLQAADIIPVLRKNVELNGFLAESKRIRISFGADSESLPVRMDAFKIEQVLNNLIQNAVKFSHPDKTIDVRTEKKGGMIVVSVKDEGQGI
ncbi:MAG TPA: hypothetical protein DCQ83_01580, partial [Fibrobacteres bacterium]|nr:hypothetical protein [Fibrobacterota bacterium]